MPAIVSSLLPPTVRTSPAVRFKTNLSPQSENLISPSQGVCGVLIRVLWRESANHVLAVYASFKSQSIEPGLQTSSLVFVWPFQD